MSLTFTKKMKISLQRKSDAYKFTVIDDKLLSYNKEIVDYEREEISLKIELYV